MKKKYAHSHVIQNLYDIRSSVEHIRYKKIKICNPTFRVPLTTKVWAKDTLEINGNLNGLVTTFLPIFCFPFNKEDILKIYILKISFFSVFSRRKKVIEV